MHERIKLLRNRLRLSLNNFAAGAGYSGTLISLVEKGATPCSEKLIDAIVKAYGVRREWLETGAGDMFEDEERNAPRETTPGERVKILRDSLKMNGGDFAKKLGYSPQMLYQIEGNAGRLTKRMICAIATTYGVRREWLETGAGDMFEDKAATIDAADARKAICLEFFDALPPRLQDALIQAISERVALSRASSTPRGADDQAEDDPARNPSAPKSQVNNGTINGGGMVQN